LGNHDQHERNTKQAFLLTIVLSSNDSNCDSLRYSRKATTLSPLVQPVGILCEQFDNSMSFCQLAILFPNLKILRYNHTGMRLSPLALVAAEAVVAGQPQVAAEVVATSRQGVVVVASVLLGNQCDDARNTMPSCR
jgi:hypothetical protein